MINLLEETKHFLNENGKKLEDVKFCVCAKGWFTLQDFIRLADREYDDGFGAQEVSETVMLVGYDFWIERHEYDGSEWWEFKTLPEKPDKYYVPNSLFIDTHFCDADDEY